MAWGGNPSRAGRPRLAPHEGRGPPRVEPAQRLETHDPELDAPRGGPPVYPSPAQAPEDYQRLVTNPFLALLGLVLWCMALRQVLEEKSLVLFLPILLSLGGVVFLLQYHCLD